MVERQLSAVEQHQPGQVQPEHGYDHDGKAGIDRFGSGRRSDELGKQTAAGGPQNPRHQSTNACGSESYAGIGNETV